MIEKIARRDVVVLPPEGSRHEVSDPQFQKDRTDHGYDRKR